MLELAFLLLAIPVLWALVDWRVGLLLCLVTATLQDPLRKLVPNQPVLFVAFVGVVFGGMCLGALVRGIPLNQSIMFRRYRQLAKPISLLLVVIVAQAFNSYVRFENPMITLIGLLTYLLPLPAIVCAYQLVSRQGEVRINQFMKWYIVCIGLALITVYLEYSGYDWPVLGTVGPQLVVFDQDTGQRLPAFSGLFRAPEIAAWHAMSAACFVLILNVSNRTTFARLLTTVLLAALLLGLGILTGRRKIAVEFVVFLGTYLILWALFEKAAGKLVLIALTGITLIGFAGLTAELREDVTNRHDTDTSYTRYVDHTQNAFESVPSRFVELGIAPVMWAYDSFGLFGAGLGVGSQGTQHFGGGGGIAGAAEGGLGKITLELGIPGLFLMGWIAISVFRYLWRTLRVAFRYSQRIGRLAIGLFSFLIANLAGFSVATQAYGDLFILLILSWTLASLLAVPVLLEREVKARKLATVAGLSPVLRPRTVEQLAQF
jgi:hypothetical protein